MRKNAEYYIKKLNMLPLFEKDFLIEVYKKNFKNNHSFSIAYYLMTNETIFPFHKMKETTSTWNYADGSPVKLFLIENNELKEYIIGPDIEKGHFLSYVVEPNIWFCAKSAQPFSLVSHYIIPSYKAENDIFGFEEEISLILKERYPSELISSLSCKKSYYKMGSGDNYFLKS